MNEAAKKWRRRCYALLLVWAIWTVATSFPFVRGILIEPLYVSQPDARGQIAYVMADGPAYWERLHAASDLYHMHRVKQIYVLNETRTSSYNFTRRASDTRLQRAIDYMAMFGVPPEVIHSVPIRPDDWLSSLSEAQGVADLPDSFDSIVVVTSPPHTRRSKLCFDRVFDDQAKIQVYSSNLPAESTETHSPIWIEYVKLVVYWFCA
ncbi:YdcF family protein [Stieleria sp. TO1_6]|uniref:YdcF family protein n=1 Tax=Stieleria tagensis TaxID=2956795 RepID=UPI00209A7537|nr:ElyC/SanA/YdcF family protein [Stieleria tagensis]MCO8122480.1 YdcF family protein [Stieleria tagensis]